MQRMYLQSLFPEEFALPLSPSKVTKSKDTILPCHPEAAERRGRNVIS